jgi:hypothetical protein
MIDSYRSLALEAIEALCSEECFTEAEYGIGDPNENYHKESDALRARLAELDTQHETAQEPPDAAS